MLSDRCEKLLSGDHQFVVAVAGGGLQLLPWLYLTPGASKFMLESRVIYAPETMERFIGYAPDKFVSEEVARVMAVKAWTLSLTSFQPDKIPVGIACTAALATDHERRGLDHAWIAVVAEGVHHTKYVPLDKDLNRHAQDFLVSNELLDQMTAL